MKISKQNFDGILMMLFGLYTTGIPCNVTLYFQDNEFNRVGKGIHVNLDQLPIDILVGRKNYVLKIRVNGYNYFVESRNPERDPSISTLLDILDDSISKMEETFVNEDRKTKLDDILNDPNPSTQVPV
jgi:hypothetical protein